MNIEAIKVLALYIGRRLVFTEDVLIDGKVAFKKDQWSVVSPSTIYLLASGKLKVSQYTIEVRLIHGITNQEWVELSAIAAPRMLYGKQHIRKVNRVGTGSETVIKVSLGRKGDYTYDLIINAFFDVSISELLKGPPGLNPIPMQLCALNQIKINRWFIDKGVDVYQLNLRK